ncbi:Kinesin protein [Rhizoctonia solani]|uniref:Kinesin protein n=1 Tax=Rhizoctonia solani TaxID=456999 RepID=A0A8H7LN01_9AGAM|nr:Kinesin protein [Rhizoctonia solani]
MSLSATRSRRWAEALAAVQLENGDAPDPDAEAPGEEFVGKEEEDVFESDFESTDEEEYAKQGVDDGEKQVQMEEKAERRAARAKASKIGAAPTQKILERAMRGEPAPKKRRISTKNNVEKRASIYWDATRQSERSSTVKHKFLVQERLKDAENRKAHAPRRPRPIAAPKTQDELIAAALELEEKNTKALNEFLQKEEEKRAAARKVVRLKIEGPVIRWISRGEVPRIEEVKVEQGTNETSIVSSQAPVQPPIIQAPSTQDPVTHAVSVPVEKNSTPVLLEDSTPLVSTSTSAPVFTPVSTPAPVSTTSHASNRASTPLRTQRMQVYVEIPTPSKSMRRSLSSSSVQGSSLALRGREASPSPVISRGLSAPLSQPPVRSPLSSTASLPRSPLSTCEPLVPEIGSSKPPGSVLSQPSRITSTQSSETASSQLPESILPQADPLHNLHRPTVVRQSSVGSSSSSKSKGKMIMFVEIPVRKKERSGTPVPDSTARTEQSSGGMVQQRSSLSDPPSSTPIPPPYLGPGPSGSSTAALTLPARTIPFAPITHSGPTACPVQKQMRNYVVVEYGGGARASFGWNMQAMFGNHADWEDVLLHGVKPLHPVKPTCAITGLPAPYRDSRTGIPYANAYAYKTLTRLLAHEFIWSKERGCYVGDEGKDPAKGVPANWRSAASGRLQRVVISKSLSLIQPHDTHKLYIMPPVTRNKAPDSSSSASGTTQQQQTRATRSSAVRSPSETKSKLAATTTSSAPPPKPVGSTLSRSATNRMSVVLPTNKKSIGTKEKDKDDREPMRAFLRIRPAPSSANSTPYIATLSETTVEMSDPSPAAPRFGMRPSLAPAPSLTYTFTRVFPPETLQPEFFASTTLPLVKDLLSGENGLVFAYGVTNSGKTFTIQGGNGKGEGGLLPRTLDVLFNSIDGLHGENKWRPAKCSSVEKEPSYGSSIKSKNGPAVEPDVESLMGEEAADRDDTTIKVDRNYEYSVFVSYAEIYNEKIFDLLASESLTSESSSMSRSGSGQSLSRSLHAKPLPKYLSALLPKSFSSHLGFGSSSSANSMSGSTGPGGEIPGSITRKALALKSDPVTNGKFVSGLREIRVRSAQEGRAILKLGQINRTVFGTVANERSSRSHAVFTIKVLRVHKGADKEDPEEVQCARLSVVDLAGSERSKNTHATGDRLKEAGNINKSLMVLGQCMEMLRANQRKISAGGTLKLGVVPFRHSKLTELFMDFFVGEGRAVMIVNVNPYDTGFDENSHVMRFSALAREVATTTQRILPPRPPPAKSSGLATARGLSTSIGPGVGTGPAPKAGSPAPPVRTARKVRLSEGTPAETVLEIVEEDETNDEDDDDDTPRDTLVDELFEEVEYLRERLFEAEMRASTIEAEIREEVMKEMEERMQTMEKMFMRRLASEVEAGESKTDRKIDMLQRAGLLQSRQDSDSEDEENIEKSLMVEDETETDDEEDEDEDEDEEEDEEEPESPTPHHKRLTGQPLATLEEGESFEESELTDDESNESGEEPQVTMGEASMDIEDDDEIPETEEEDQSTPSKSRKQRVESDEEEYEQDEDEDEEEEEEEYVPTPPTKSKSRRESTSRTPKSKGKAPGNTPKAKRDSTPSAPPPGPDQDGDESMLAAAIVPNKRARAARLSASGPGSTYIPAPGEPEAVKKKKRQLGKVSAMTEDQIWAAAMKVDHEKQTMGVRRFGRGSR